MTEKKTKTEARQGERKPGQERVLRRSLIVSAEWSQDGSEHTILRVE